MSVEDRSFQIDKFNVSNSNQRDDVEFCLWHQFIKPSYTYGGRLGRFFYRIMCQQFRLVKYDARWKETKAMEAARGEVIEALRRYDDACDALMNRINTK